MGRFKVYDSKELVKILNDPNYVNCLLCERKLKNIMGNIKRHYEQMHSVYVNANVNKLAKKTRKRSAKFRDDDKEYKIPKRARKSIDVIKQKDMPINEFDRTKTIVMPSEIPSTKYSRSHDNRICASEQPELQSAIDCQSSDSCINRKVFPHERSFVSSEDVTTTTRDISCNNYYPSAAVLPVSDSVEYNELNSSDSKLKFTSKESPIFCNQYISITPVSKTERPINPITPAPVFQESKLKENEKCEIYLSTGKKKQPPTPYSDVKKNKVNDDNEEIQIPCYSYINNIQIDSMDSCHPLEFLKCLVETKTHVNIPLKFFQKADTFQKALQSWKPNFQFNYSSQTIGENIDRMAKTLRHEITKMVANRIIYLKLDVVSSTQGNVMFVNIQFIKDFQIKVITLSALELLDDDLATYLKQKVITILERYKIDIGRVYSIIKDNTNNFGNSPLKLIENSPHIHPLHENMEDSNIFPQSIDYCQHLCQNFPGHAIHFVASDIIKELNENISQSRDSAKSLRRELSQLNIEQLPLLDNTTSWFSVYDMIESLLTFRETVESNKLLVAEVDWLFAIKFVSSFRPIVDTALMLQTNESFIMGDLYREWLLCEMKLEELSATNEIALYLLDALRKRKLDLFKNTSFLAALYLDPRFCYKGSMCLSDKQKEMAITQFQQIFNKLRTFNADTTSLNSTKHTDINLNDRYSKLEELTAANLKTKVEKMTSYDTICWSNADFHWVKESLVQLQFEERLPFSTNILEYWNLLKHKSPILAKIAEIALAAPATQATINRALNISSINLIRRKLIQNTDNTDNLILLKLNQDLVNKITLEN